jgi:hydrogenase maturation factor
VLPGKVPPDVLERIVFSKLGKSDPDIILGPGIGQDASVLKVGDKVIIASTDPITGSVEDIGWLAVHINANDIATFGVQPRWFLTSIMLPSGTSEKELERIIEQIHSAARDLGISVAGGHTEITETLTYPIIAGFMIGDCNPGEYVTSSGAVPDDAILMTKSAGIEGTAILAAEGAQYLGDKMDDHLLKEARALRDKISVVAEGIAAVKTGFVTAMHDPTEGGLSGGLHEIADASGVGFTIDLEKIPIAESTLKICDVLTIDWIELISSGCMLLTCKSECVEDVLKAIRDVGVHVERIGTVVLDESTRTVLDSKGERELPRPQTDALWDALKKVNPP